MCTEMRINMNIHKVLQSSAIALTAMTVSCFNMPAMTVTQILQMKILIRLMKPLHLTRMPLLLI